jgi:hypothetical protein
MRVFIAALLGAWLMGNVAMAVVATQNFRAVDRVLRAAAGSAGSLRDPHIARSAPSELIRLMERLPAAEARMLLRYLASEMNRFYFRIWGWGQLLLALLTLGGLWAGGVEDRVVHASVVAMLALVLVAVFALTPEITAIGRRLDFAPRNPPPPEFARFWRFHTLYTLLDLAKMGLGLLALIRLARLP